MTFSRARARSLVSSRREKQKTTIAWEFLAISDGGGDDDEVQSSSPKLRSEPEIFLPIYLRARTRLPIVGEVIWSGPVFSCDTTNITMYRKSDNIGLRVLESRPPLYCLFGLAQSGFGIRIGREGFINLFSLLH